jgi:alpha-acetolactate decarboxylase
MTLGISSRILAVCCVVALAGCKARRDSEPKSLEVSGLKPAAPVIPVTLHNTLRGLNEGKLDATVELDSLRGNPKLVGLGSLSGLRGEVAIVNGEVWVSYPSGEGARTERLHDQNETAAFTATSEVQAWTSQELAIPVPYERIPEMVRRAAIAANYDRTRPFPIVIEGEFTDIEFNVVDGAALKSDKPTRADMLRTAEKVSLSRAQGTLVGFYSEPDSPDLIHPGQRVHLHVVLPAVNQMGHLDSISIEPGARLRLPQG